MAEKLIEPTPGRVVLFHPEKHDVRLWGQYDGGHVFCALIADVHSPYLVNLMVVGHDGYPHPRINVKLVNGDVARPHHNDDAFCEWMPYQKGQAAKSEELEKQLASKAGK